MSVSDRAQPARAGGGFDSVFHFGCFGLCVAHAVFLVWSYVQGVWLVDGLGRGVPTDFINVWAAGRLVLEGTPAAAYDWETHKQVEFATVGYDFSGYYAWLYPPPFLSIAAILALLPYALAHVCWTVFTLPLYLATVRWLVGERIGLLLAFAFPPVLGNIMVGQNGFLTATLVGGSVGWMQRRPVLAGICLGLLTYKPQFGLVFPIVLVVTRQWTVFLTAAAVALALAVASWLLFGWIAWEQFFHGLKLSSEVYLSGGRAEWSKLQSVYGLVREAGGSEPLGWALQAMLAVATVMLLCVLWRSAALFEMKAAATAAGALLATPYVYLYDMVVLAVPVALLVRCALASGWRPLEPYGLVATAALLFVYPFVTAPLGLAATLVVMAMVVGRAWPAEPGRVDRAQSA
jgi:arabinofuranan 3-O-arabinosyltransferase